jgi:altronate dehydratase
MTTAILIDKSDNVAMVTASVKAGEEVYVTETGQTIIAAEPINAGHKIALARIEAGEYAVKYGIPIGRMTAAADIGQWVHSHNLDDITAELCGEYCRQFRAGDRTIKPFTEETTGEIRKIKAYPRANGTFGIRNYIMVIPTTPDGNAAAEAISDATGCAWFVCDRTRLEDGELTQYTKQAMIYTGRNPNLYAVLVIGSALNESTGKEIYDAISESGKPIGYLEVGANTQAAVDEGSAIVEQFQKSAAQLKREPVSMEGFGLAVHCSGSDWTTALNGNAVVGAAADLVVKNNGRVFMTEWMEWSGSQHLMAEKCITREIGLELLDTVDKVRDVVLRETGKPVEYMNPAPGNKEGGLTTLVEKSVGTIRKVGSTPIRGLLNYCEQPTGKGVWLPKHDSVWPPTTATYASLCGAHMSVLNTGLGYLYFEIPHLLCIRTTGNPVTYGNEEFRLDFDSGVAFTKPIAEVGETFFDYLIRIAEGDEEPKTETNKDRAFNMYYYVENEFGQSKDSARKLPAGVKDYHENRRKFTDSVK